MSDIYERIPFDLDKITDEYMRRITAATDELMDEKLASIGYVKVVRCRDCEHYKGAICLNGFIDGVPDAFCSWGERRDA